MGRNLRTAKTQAVAVILPLGREFGQPVSDPFSITLPEHVTPQTAYETIGEFLNAGNRVDGIVAATDIMP